jgi:hypothetical protein
MDFVRGVSKSYKPIHTQLARSADRACFDQVVRLHDILCSIVCDRDFWQELFHLLGTTLRLSCVFHPKTLIPIKQRWRPRHSRLYMVVSRWL